MHLALNGTQEAVRDEARRFAQAEIAPHARGWDAEERFPAELIPKLGALGYLGINIPAEHGGSELDTICYALIVEEVSRADGSMGITVASHNGLGSSHIASFGDEAMCARYLPRLATGAWLGAWALTEPGSGSDAAGLRTRAIRDGDHWVLDGSKTFTTQGSVCGVCVVLASTDPQQGRRGITAFAVEADTPGYEARAMHGKYGVRASDTAEITLTGVRIADSQRIGAVGSGFTDAMRILDKGRISIGAMALGLGEGALSAAVAYAKQREAFGHPIAEFQAIQWMIADSRTELDAARMLLYRAAALADAGQPYGAEASMAKLYASEAGHRACDRALQIHGGYGYVNEFPVERHLRDVRVCRIGEGASEIQRRIIAKAALA